MTSLEERVANLIGYQLAAMVSRNNMPDMSGDPRNRIQPAMRRRFDEACQDAARAAIAVCAEEMAKEVEAMRWYVETTPGHIRAKEPADYAAAIRSMGERG